MLLGPCSGLHSVDNVQEPLGGIPIEKESGTHPEMDILILITFIIEKVMIHCHTFRRPSNVAARVKFAEIPGEWDRIHSDLLDFPVLLRHARRMCNQVID